MKKTLLLVILTAATFFAASCQRELAPVEGEGLSTVTFNVSTPAIATKAYSDGKTATTLQYAVYDAEGNILNDFTVTDGTINSSANVDLQLTTGNTYSVIFWAAAPGAPYTVNFTDKTMDVDYNGALSNDEGRDAFYKYHTFTVNGAQTETIELKRPFAQLNIGTADLAASTAAGYTPTRSSVTVENVYETLNLATGAVSDEAVVVFAENAIPSGQTFPVANNEYLAMNYLLVSAEKEVVDLTFTYTDGTTAKTRTVGAVPVQRNYRTNIYGNLLTSDVDVNVEIEPDYETPDHLVYVWDGSEISKPSVSEEDDNIYEITYASELAWLAAAVNGTLPATKSTVSADSFAGKTFRLTQDVDLGGNEWTPIGKANSDSKNFEGTFDGNGHTIKNLCITKGSEGAGLFKSVAGEVTIKDLTIANASVTYPGKGDFYGSALLGTAYGKVTIENVTVKDSYISGNNKVAAILAHDGGMSSFKIDNCHVEGCVIESLNEEDGGNVAGLVGLFNSNIEATIKKSSVKKTTINGINSTNTGKRSNGEFVGCMGGKDKAVINITECEVSENTFNQNEGVTYVSPYGVFVGGNRDDNGKGIVIVDGVQMIAAGLVKNGDTFEVSTAAGLQKAIELAEDGNVVKFMENIEQTDGILITDKNIKIDLNQKTFTVSVGASTNNRNFKINGSSVVTIENGTMVAAGEYSSGAYGTVRTEGTANVTLNNVKLYNYRGNGLNVKALAGTTVNITASEVYSEYGGGIESAGGTIVLKEVKVEQKGMYTAPYNSMAISVNGGGTVTVESGTYSTVCLTSEEANNQGSSHGPWVAGVLNSGGTLIINGGTFSNDNFGENNLATAARGSILADTGANVQINGGTFTALKNIIDIQNNLGDASKNPTVTIKGGSFNADPCTYEGLIKIAEGYMAFESNGEWTVKLAVPTATVGNVTYYSIDDAIANWTNGSTLTLLTDVTLSDVVTLKSTEHHILNLSTYTMTAASGKHAIEITCNARSSASYALTVNADATNPGGITATGKSCIYYKKSTTEKDRPIILINNGVFTGSYSINSTSNGNTNCPQVWINGGVFNSYINLTKNMLRISGGTFHGAINCTGDSSAYREIKGGRFKSWQFMTADAPNKFWVGSGNGNYNVGVYVDDEGYLVVGGDVITDFGDKFEAKATNYSKWSSYLKYSSAATYGLYYTNADAAIAKHGAANVELKK